MQKLIDRYDLKINEMQKQLDSLISINEDQREDNERLNTELTDLIDLHQVEVSSIKTDLKNLEQRLVYKFNDYWNELLEKLDKLDTRVSFLPKENSKSLSSLFDPYYLRKLLITRLIKSARIRYPKGSNRHVLQYVGIGFS